MSSLSATSTAAGSTDVAAAARSRSNLAEARPLQRSLSSVSDVSSADGGAASARSDAAGLGAEASAAAGADLAEGRPAAASGGRAAAAAGGQEVGGEAARGEKAAAGAGEESEESSGSESGAPCPKVPRGYRVTAILPLPGPWAGFAAEDQEDDDEAPEVPLNVPALFSLRKLLYKQHPEVRRAADKGGRRPPTPQGLGEGRSSAEKGEGEEADSAPPLPEPPPGLEAIGKHDPLSEAIRSMENRLARQGLLAAPTTILGDRGAKKVSAGDAELFYDPTDTFIDDADLEEVNAYDKQRRRPATGAEPRRGRPPKQEKAAEERAEDDDSDDDAGSQQPKGKKAQTLNLAAFRLSGAEVSGTSGEESGSDMDSDLEGAHRVGLIAPKLPVQNWREQTAMLGNELVLVPAFATGLHSHPLEPGVVSPRAPPPADAPAAGEAQDVDAPAASQMSVADGNCGEVLDADAEGADLTELRAALCQFGAAAEQGARKRMRSQVQDHIEAAIGTAYRQLPALTRPTTKGPRPLRWKIDALEPYKSEASYPGDVFPWGEVEEVAWGRYLWRIVKSAAPSIGRSCFMRRYISAVREPQREIMNEALAQVKSQLREVLAHTGRDAFEEAVRRWSSSEDTVGRKVHLRAFKPLVGAVKNLQKCWFRKLFWDEQRKLCRLRATMRKLSAAQIPCFSIYVAKHLNDFVELSVPMDMAMQLVKQEILVQRPFIERQRRRQKTRSVIPNGYLVPLRLPLSIWINIGDGKVTATLQAVHGLDRQSVIVGQNRHYPSLQQAGCAALRDAMTSLSAAARPGAQTTGVPMRLRNCLLQKHGAWTLWRFNAKGKTMPLTYALKLADFRKIVPFVNPAGEPPCAMMRNPQNPNRDLAAKREERLEWIRNLCEGQWVQCLYTAGTQAKTGKHYNAQIVNIRRTNDATARTKPLVDVEFVHGERENEVNVSRLYPVKIWEEGEQVAVRLSGQWWRGTVTQVFPHKETSGLRFEVKLDNRTVVAPFGDLRQEYSPKRKMAAGLLGIGSMKSSASAFKKGVRQSGGSGASAASSGGRPSTGQLQAVGVAPSSSSTGASAFDPVLMRGTQVKYKEKGMWHRAKVMQDHGAKVMVATHGQSKKRGGEEVLVMVDKSEIVRLQGRPGYSAGAGRSLPPAAPSVGARGGVKAEALDEEEDVIISLDD